MKHTAKILVPAREWKDSTTREVVKTRPAFSAVIEVEIDIEELVRRWGPVAACATGRRSVLGGGVVKIKSLSKKPDAVRVLSPRFIVGGDDTTAYSLRDMLATNKDDPDLCEWLKTAKPGDKFINGAGCECIAGLPASWKEAA